MYQQSKLIALSLLFAVVTANAEPPSKDYVLRFNDDFRGYTPLNREKWSTHLVCWGTRNFANIGQQQIYVERGFNGLNVSPHRPAKGIMQLVARESGNLTQSAGFPYTSGMITTEKSYNGTYGYYEIRARAPKGRGFLSGIWMFPSDCGNHRPEIDILEVFGDPTTTIYNHAHPEAGTGTERNLRGGHTTVNLIDAANDFHTYGLEWTREYISWRVDGKETRRVANYSNQPLYLLISVAVGGNWQGHPDNTTPFPSSMDIDYVKIYTK